MLPLDALLKNAAEAPDWTSIVHRCAWCGRVTNDRGEWVRLRVVRAEDCIATDGMCPRCGTRALAQIARRKIAHDDIAA
jgi:hypothetical protein